jgi:hypothetical protein
VLATSQVNGVELDRQSQQAAEQADAVGVAGQGEVVDADGGHGSGLIGVGMPEQ